MAQKDIYSVIEDLLEADMTKKDEIDNPQDKMSEEEEMEEAKEVSNQSADAKTAKPKGDNESSDDQGVLGKESGTAMDAGGDKDVGGSKGDNASDASADTQGVEGKEKGAALDAGGDKDVGKIGSKEKGNPSDASAEVEADKGPHKQAGEGMKESDEMEEEDAIEEADQDTSVQKNANDAELPSQDKETLGKEQSTSSEVAADKGPHAQANDDHDTATKANPKTKISEEDDEELEEGEMPDALKKNAEKMKKGDLPGQKNEEDDMEEDVDPDLDKDGDGDHDKDDHALEEGKYAENVMKAAEMYNENDDCTYEMAAEKYGCSAEEVKSCCEGMMKESDDEDMEEELVGGQKKLDKDKDGDIDADDLAKVRKDGVDEEADDMDEEEEMNEEFKQRASVIFETAVNEKVMVVRDELQEAYDTKLEEVKAEMNEKVSEYVDYAVQEWMQENALEIRYSLRTEIAENFIRGLKGLFEESYIEIPEEEISVVDELTETVETYKEQIAEQSDELAELRKEILSIQKQEIVDEIAEDLTETQKIRLEKLSESVEADDIDEFRYKMEELKEGYFDPSSEQPLLGDLTEEVYGGVHLEEDDTTVSQYAKFLSKTVLK